MKSALFKAALYITHSDSKDPSQKQILSSYLTYKSFSECISKIQGTENWLTMQKQYELIVQRALRKIFAFIKNIC